MSHATVWERFQGDSSRTFETIVVLRTCVEITAILRGDDEEEFPEFFYTLFGEQSTPSNLEKVDWKKEGF